MSTTGNRPLVPAIVRVPRGKDRTVVNIEDIYIPDLWHVAMSFAEGSDTRAAVLDCWYLAHDMLGALKGMPEYLDTEPESPHENNRR